MLLRKLYFLLLGLMLSNLLPAADGITQDLSKTIIPIQLQNASLKQAFRKIEAETKLLFTFKTKDVSAYNNITYNSPGVTVARLLTDLLNGTDLQYEQMENNIIIKNKILLKFRFAVARENTLHSLNSAAKNGADFVEFDDAEARCGGGGGPAR